MNHTEFILYIGLLALAAVIAWFTYGQIFSSHKNQDDEEKALENERDGLERRVSERTQELQESERKRIETLERAAHFGELSKGILHDLLSPLSSLALFIESMSTEKKSIDEAHALAQKTVAASKRLGSFMDSVRRSITEGEQAIESKKCDLQKEIQIVCDILGYKARTLDIQILRDCQENILINVSPIRIHQIILNLVSNAIDASSLKYSKSYDTEKYVKITAHGNTNAVEIIVSDNGVGISPEKLKTLFTSPSTTKDSGSGIGLKTIKSIVEKELGGTLRVESEEHAGTTFTISIPTKS